ncbi:MAG: LON peptidase substrate-binding domain-containing protein [Dehalococcoidia bacterium]
MSRLRLFPLRTVLFPGMELPLQVFEDRYRTLVAECIQNGEPFGVSLIREGPEVGGPAVPHQVGCTARIVRVSPTRDGRLALQCVGVRRFRIVQLYDDRAYLSADVEYPVDETGEVDPEALEAVRARLRRLYRLRDTIANEYHRDVDVPESPGLLADRIGALGRGLLTDRQLQQLLATLDVRRRFELADDVLTAAVSSTHEQAAAVVAQRWAALERRN